MYVVPTVPSNRMKWTSGTTQHNALIMKRNFFGILGLHMIIYRRLKIWYQIQIMQRRYENNFVDATTGRLAISKFVNNKVILILNKLGKLYFLLITPQNGSIHKRKNPRKFHPSKLKKLLPHEGWKSIHANISIILFYNQHCI